MVEPSRRARERQTAHLRWLAPAALVLACAGLEAADDPAGHEPRTLETVPQLCTDCHGTIPEPGRYVHEPAGEGRCLSCHDPHASWQEALLRGTDRELCLSCHHAVRDALAGASHRHGALREERACRGCHAPHAADLEGLIRQPMPQLCDGCHGAIQARVSLASPHAPAEEGECTVCHDPHAAARRALLVDARTELCATCHEPADLVGAHHGFRLEGVDCTSCHDPHGSPSARLVRERVHPPFEEGDCELCHEDPGAPQDLVGPVNELCRECHDDKGGVGHAEHYLDETVRCTSCHSPHAGVEPAIMRSKPRGLCLDCHEDIARRIEQGRSIHPLEAEEGRCTACHQPHRAGAAPLLKDEAYRMCSTCHEEHARFTHPMGPNVPDPRDPSRTVDCLSCHDAHGSDQRMLLRASPERELCVQCHQELH